METPGSAGAPSEPEWPSWRLRDEVDDLVEYGRGVCPCRWLEATYEDLSLFGGVVWSAHRCVDCGAVWERRSQT